MEKGATVSIRELPKEEFGGAVISPTLDREVYAAQMMAERPNDQVAAHKREIRSACEQRPEQHLEIALACHG